MKTYNR